jgi:hypothetical protein
VTFLYRYRNGLGGEWEDVQEPVSLDWTDCNFGGKRPWFVGVLCGPVSGGDSSAYERMLCRIVHIDF